MCAILTKTPETDIAPANGYDTSAVDLLKKYGGYIVGYIGDYKAYSGGGDELHGFVWTENMIMRCAKAGLLVEYDGRNIWERRFRPE
jgi:hypothetical protein